MDWVFNAWGGLDGGLYYPWAFDDQVAAKVCELEGGARYRAPFVLEGGSIHVDGEGTCITTEECLLNPNRNPELTREAIEDLLGSYLGVETVIWIPRGVYGDETDGHIDNLACFSRPGRVLLTWSEDGGDPQAAISRRGPKCWSRPTDARGRRLEVGLLPSPGPLAVTAGEAAGVDRQRARPAPPGRRPHGRLLRQLPHHQHLGRPSPPRCGARRGGCRASGRGVPRPPDRRGTGPGDPAGRGQRPLHHPTGAQGLTVHPPARYVDASRAQPTAGSGLARARTVRSRMPRVARRAPSDRTGKIPASRHAGSMADQS